MQNNKMRWSPFYPLYIMYASALHILKIHPSEHDCFTHKYLLQWTVNHKSCTEDQYPPPNGSPLPCVPPIINFVSKGAFSCPQLLRLTYTTCELLMSIQEVWKKVTESVRLEVMGSCWQSRLILAGYRRYLGKGETERYTYTLQLGLPMFDRHLEFYFFYHSSISG